MSRSGLGISRVFMPLGILVSLFTFCDSVFSSVQSVQSSPNLLARFIKETPEAWRRIEAADETPGTIKITTTISTYSNGQLSKREEKAALLRRKAGCYLFEPEQSRGGTRNVFGKNPRYSYSVSKDDLNADYALDEVRLKGHKSFGEIPLDLVQYVRPNSYGFIPSLGSLAQIVRSSHFKAFNAEEIDRGMIRVHFKTTIVVPGKQLPITGWMDFDPNNAWTLEKLRYETSPGSTSEIVKVFSPSVGAEYRPCQSWGATHKSTVGEKWEMKQETQFEIVDSGTPPDELFTLTHYSLPEPVGISPPQRTTTWVWLLVATIVATAGAFLCAWLKRRRRLLPLVQRSRASAGRAP